MGKPQDWSEETVPHTETVSDNGAQGASSTGALTITVCEVPDSHTTDNVTGASGGADSSALTPTLTRGRRHWRTGPQSSLGSSTKRSRSAAESSDDDAEEGDTPKSPVRRPRSRSRSNPDRGGLSFDSSCKADPGSMPPSAREVPDRSRSRSNSDLGERFSLGPEPYKAPELPGGVTSLEEWKRRMETTGTQDASQDPEGK